MNEPMNDFTKDYIVSVDKRLQKWESLVKKVLVTVVLLTALYGVYKVGYTKGLKDMAEFMAYQMQQQGSASESL